MSLRLGLLDIKREQLVALQKPAKKNGRLTAGAHLSMEGADVVSQNDQGYFTYVCYSPTLGHDLALAFLNDGSNRHGDRVLLVDHLCDVQIWFEV
jgi:glycine cleavage system aminomethyltransferase T